MQVGTSRVLSLPRAQTIPSPHPALLGVRSANGGASRDSFGTQPPRYCADRHAADGLLASPSGTHKRRLHSSSPCAPQGEAFKVRQDRASDVDRSHLKLEGCDLPSTRGSSHRQRTPADPEAASDPFSLSESENDGLTSRPVRSFARMAKEMQTHPSPSVRPVTYHGSSATATP